MHIHKIQTRKPEIGAELSLTDGRCQTFIIFWTLRRAPLFPHPQFFQFRYILHAGIKYLQKWRKEGAEDISHNLHMLKSETSNSQLPYSSFQPSP